MAPQRCKIPILIVAVNENIYHIDGLHNDVNIYGAGFNWTTNLFMRYFF